MYKYCFSLGWFCGNASSMSRLGLRSVAGPFDWCYSDYWAVLEHIEKRFKDFMKYENLEEVYAKEKTFIDRKYGFYCNHDIVDNLKDEYDDIYKKYVRRYQRFLKMIEEPTLFFRVLRNNEEVAYINENWQYADKLLRSFNDYNRVIYIRLRSMVSLTSNVSSICLDVDEFEYTIVKMRRLFDYSEELIELCSQVLLPNVIEENKRKDKENNVQKISASMIKFRVEEDEDGVDISILNGFGINKNTPIYIWGAGKYGSLLTEYLAKRGVQIKGIIDNHKKGLLDDKYKIICPDEIERDSYVFIAIYQKDINDAIEQQIQKMNKGIIYLKYSDLYEDSF